MQMLHCIMFSPYPWKKAHIKLQLQATKCAAYDHMVPVNMLVSFGTVRWAKHLLIPVRKVISSDKLAPVLFYTTCSVTFVQLRQLILDLTFLLTASLSFPFVSYLPLTHRNSERRMS